MIHHVADEIIRAYDTVETVENYKVCGEELREAYVGLKRLRHVRIHKRAV
jgi:hypothetical protein